MSGSFQSFWTVQQAVLTGYIGPINESAPTLPQCLRCSLKAAHILSQTMLSSATNDSQFSLLALTHSEGHILGSDPELKYGRSI